MLLRKTLYAFLTPPNLFFILLLCVYLFYYKRWARKLLLAVTMAFIILSMPLVADRLHNYLNLYPSLSIQQIKNSKAQAIVLLSGGIYGYSDEYERSMPNANSILRALYTARIFKYNHLPILISGGEKHEGSATGATILQNFMQLELNTPVRWLETQSTTTFENALFSSAFLNHYGIHNIILVTESWHMRRAVTVFEQHGFNVLPAPTFASRSHYRFNMLDSIIPTSQAFNRSQIALHEILGIIWYQLEMLTNQINSQKKSNAVLGNF